MRALRWDWLVAALGAERGVDGPLHLPTGGAVLHELKCWPDNFEATLAGVKSFEWRRDDRVPPFDVGDMLWLREWRVCEWCEGHGIVLGSRCACWPRLGTYTGRAVLARVTYVLRGRFGVPDGYVVLGLDLGVPTA